MRCAVIGSPIAHSLSPAMHRAAYAELGLDWTYDAVDLQESALATFLQSLGDDVRGLSITAPLKRAVAGLTPTRSDVVTRLGVANTLVIEDGQHTVHNTDVPGAVAALAERDVNEVSSARILGSGATAWSLAYALSTIGCRSVEFVVRDPGRGAEAAHLATSAGLETTVRGMDEPLLDKVDLLVSTVPSEAIGSLLHELVQASRAVFDVVYDPWPSRFGVLADEAGVPYISGLDLLAHQAALQVELMTGRGVSPQLLRDAAMGELTAR